MFADLQDKIRESFTTAWSKVQDNPTFNTLVEKFETLPATTQKIIVISSIALMSLFVLSIPYSYLSSSAVSVTDFEEYRGLIRDLLKVTRNKDNRPPLPSDSMAQSFSSRYKDALSNFELLPEQIGEVSAVDMKEFVGLKVPPGITRTAFGLQLKKLNLNQIVDIGYSLQTLQAAVKMMGIDIVATKEDPHYYDAQFKFVAFTMPEIESEDGGTKPQPKKRFGQ